MASCFADHFPVSLGVSFFSSFLVGTSALFRSWKWMLVMASMSAFSFFGCPTNNPIVLAWCWNVIRNHIPVIGSRCGLQYPIRTLMCSRNRPETGGNEVENVSCNTQSYCGEFPFPTAQILGIKIRCSAGFLFTPRSEVDALSLHGFPTGLPNVAHCFSLRWSVCSSVPQFHGCPLFSLKKHSGRPLSMLV